MYAGLALGEESIKTLEKKLDYRFNNAALLNQALTHRSCAGQENNERFEFLGDAILSHIIAEELFQRYPTSREGDLSRMRSALVCGEKLAEIAKRLTLGDFIKLGAGEQRSGGQSRRSILANAVEAIIGAIYLDAGFNACRDVVLNIYGNDLTTLPTDSPEKDAKSTLQEWAQARRLPLPSYEATITGEAHAQRFHVTCRVEGLPHETQGVSTNRRQAEQAAAKAYLELLDE